MPRGDAAAIAAATAELLRDKSQLATFAAARNSIAERFDTARLIQQWESELLRH